MELNYMGKTASKLPKVDGMPQYIAAFTKNIGQQPIYTAGSKENVQTYINDELYQLTYSRVSPTALGATRAPKHPLMGEDTAFAVWAPVRSVGANDKGFKHVGMITSSIVPQNSSAKRFFALGPEPAEIIPDGYDRRVAVWFEESGQPTTDFDWVADP
jgi:hypothetical protein